MALNVGDKAPAFFLPTDGGGMLSLKDLKDKMVVLYFYPKDDTPGCTIETKDFNSFLKKSNFFLSNFIIIHIFILFLFLIHRTLSFFFS